MRKTIELPAPELSQLKRVDIDLDMTGRHYALLATSEGNIPEELALSILKDLVVQDANKLTLAELRYLFMLVKINAMDNNYNAYVYCTHFNPKTKKDCNYKNEVQIRLSDADLNRTPHGYKVPEIEFVIDNTQQMYKVMPPTADMEISLLNYLIVEKGIPQIDLQKDKTTALKFSFIRAMMHLVNDKGERVISQVNQFDECEKLFDVNKYTTIRKLFSLMEEVDGFGVQEEHVYHFKCKECGGELVFTIPLLYGFSNSVQL